MTKKDYIKLAKLIRTTQEYHAIDRDDGFYYLPITLFIEGLCVLLQEDNPRFARERFTVACER